MTPNNQMTLETAKDLLKAQNLVLAFAKKNGLSNGQVSKIENIITAARTVQRAEDAEIVNKILKGKCTCTAVYGNACDCGKYLEEAKQKILTPEAPLSDNQK